MTFARLQDVILPPPLSALSGALLTLGIWQLGRSLARRWRSGRADGLEQASSFVAAVAGISAVAHALAWLGRGMVWELRALGAVLAALGLWRAVELARALPSLLDVARNAWRAATALERAGSALGGLTALGLTLAALGPPTDADSLDYHLGVPLDWLRHGGAYARPDWYHARLVGLGESLNLLGLANGSEQLGACLQAAGLFAAVAAVSALAASRRDRVLALLFVVSAPAMAFLVPNQKPMLLPAAATTASLLLLARARSAPDGWTLAMAFTGVSFAVGSKTSFLLSAAVVLAAGAIHLRRSGWLARGAGLAALCGLGLAGPVLLRTLRFYGDPISPFLERFKPHPDPGLVVFAHYLREIGGVPSLHTYAWMPWTLVVPESPGAVTLVLGVGVWALALAVRARGTAAVLAVAAGVAALLELALGQLAPRFLVEPYLWAAAAVVGMPRSRPKDWALGALTAQGAGAAAMAVYAAATLMPGSLSPSLRAQVMERAAFGAAEAQWMDRSLPPDAVLYAPSRSHALLPRPFNVADELSGMVTRGTGSPRDREALWSRDLRAAGVDTVVAAEPPADPAEALLLGSCATPLGPPVTLRGTARNPWNRGAEFTLRAWRVHWDQAGCPSGGPPGR